MSENWQTPKVIYDKLNAAAGGFLLDAAAEASNALAPNYYGPGSPLAEDALGVPLWLSPAFCNPPYLKGKRWDAWMEKFVEQGKLGVKVVTILPAKVGTEWWSKYVVDAHADIMFFVGRLPFTQPGMEKPSQPNHDSALVIYGPLTQGKVSWLHWKSVVAPATTEADE